VLLNPTPARYILTLKKDVSSIEKNKTGIAITLFFTQQSIGIKFSIPSFIYNQVRADIEEPSCAKFD
jgi:hypothetical protein